MKDTFVHRSTVIQLELGVATDQWYTRSIPLYKGDVLASISIFGYVLDPSLLSTPNAVFAFALVAHNNFIPDVDGSITPPPSLSVPVIPLINISANNFTLYDLGLNPPGYQATFNQAIHTFFRADSSTQHLLFAFNPVALETPILVSVFAEILTSPSVLNTD